MGSEMCIRDSDVPWREELTSAPEIRDGELVVPAGPGWGCDVDEDVVRAHPATT